MNLRLLVLFLLSPPVYAQHVWSPAAPLLPGPGDDLHPSFVVSSTAFLPWMSDEWLAFSRGEGPPGARAIRVLRSAPGATSWPDSPMVVIRDSAVNILPSIARRISWDDTQRVCVAWERTRPGEGATVALSMFTDTGWSPPVHIDRGGGDDHEPFLAASDSGFGIVWIRRGAVQVSYERNGSWTLPAEVSAPGDSTCTRPRLYWSPYPRSWCVLWESRKGAGPERLIVSAVSTGSAWERDTLARDGDNRNPSWVHRSWEPDVQAAWESDRTGRWQIFGAVGQPSATGLSWAPPYLCSFGTPTDDHSPALQLFPIITRTGAPLIWATTSACVSAGTDGDSIALSAWLVNPVYRTGGAGAEDRRPVLSSGVPSPSGARVWAVWESNPGGSWSLYGSTIDLLLGVEEEGAVPARVHLSPAWPNPFNGTTRCRVYLTERTEVRVGVVNLLGREVAVLMEGVRGPGEHTAVWTADGAASGVYAIRLTAGGRAETTRVVVLR